MRSASGTDSWCWAFIKESCWRYPVGVTKSPDCINLSATWAVSNREMLIAQNSSLEFKLHRLYFISLLMGGTTNQREALQYAKNFQPFALNHQKDIQVLMGSLVYLRQGIENSPYVHLLDANQWADICDIFTRDACALLGLSVESPLSVRFICNYPVLPAGNCRLVAPASQRSVLMKGAGALPVLSVVGTRAIPCIVAAHLSK
ncbi:Protein RMD5 A, partial [Eschrichtius robustus]|nr:Protein RMD5 A [Eschrichtius robustus]